MSLETDAEARGVLESLDADRLVLALPGTDYRIHLTPAVPVKSVKTPTGKRIRGTIHARALRIHPAAGGGRFIEPVIGAPRIVAGTVLAIDDERNRVLVDVAVPMWVSWQEGQDTSVLQLGRLVNFYVESGTSFEPRARS